MSDAHPAERLDDTVHQRVRLGLLAVLVEVPQADFTVLRSTLGLTDGNLATHLQVLEAAGLVTTTKRFEAKRPRTYVAVTSEGRKALQREIDALRDLVARVDATRSKAPAPTRRRAPRTT